MKPAHWIPIIHGIKCRHLIDAHGWHLQYPGHLVHDADAGKAMLPLPEVEQGHHGRFLVLRRVAFEDFGDESLVEGGELERDGRVIDGGVAVLQEVGVAVRKRLVGKEKGGRMGDVRLGGLRLPRAEWWRETAIAGGQVFEEVWEDIA